MTARIVSPRTHVPSKPKDYISAARDQLSGWTKDQVASSESDAHLARIECNRHATSDVECREFYRMLGVVPGVVQS